MNKKIIEKYAPEARKAFIQAVKDKAALYGITEKKVLPCEVKGDFAFINGRPFPGIVYTQRDELLTRIKDHSFGYIMEETAYTWFNRFAAIRFMEINGYLSHGYRVLSHPQGHSIPEIVEKAQFVNMPGLDKDQVIRLKMAGDRDEELYTWLLIAQCNEMSAAMPFLFEKVDDPTELLLPHNLLHTGSVIRDMVETIPEEDWREVEIIGWLYQFYISEKKDELMAAKKAYKSEDIPAVTQLFTPNWIVKYLVQNSLGAKWLRTYPNSSLKDKMEYYIEPAEQTPEVMEELKRITPSSLNPEELTVMDPACGSGHILAEAYDLMKEIYLERGYRKRDIPRLILEKNLFGLEIDDRAAQLAGFALMMKARSDDREIFGRKVQPNVVVIKGKRLGAEAQRYKGTENGENSLCLSASEPLYLLFENADTFGSLIRIPHSLKKNLPVIKEEIDELEKKGDLLSYNIIEDMRHIVRQTELLSCKYDVVVANPPYMGRRKMNLKLKKLADKEYPNTKSDLFAMFIERGFEMAKSDTGHNAIVTMQSWMFLSSYHNMRESLINFSATRNMVHMSNGVMGIAFGTSATIWFNARLPSYKGSFSYVDYSDLSPDNVPIEFPIKNDRLREASSEDLKKIPGSPIAYWVSDKVRETFQESVKLSEIAETR
ncbi:BREX-1 system adenine-specific DNA-methyltransferase PglX, partial [Candidatus Poribacteria bacterium]|nr:BREX-1 system adenine-specific DNA-methyltransferase PglX [Candidatus Poribacteria bacterium]